MADFTTPRVSEKKFYTIPDQLFVADGTIGGLVTVASTYSYKVGQIIQCFSSSLQHRRLKIKRVISETQFYVGEENTNISTYTDMSAFLVSDGATVVFKESLRPVIDILEIQRQVYEEEPTVALRSHSVDWLGRPYDKTNPMPVQLSDGSINIGSVNAELEVQLSHKDNYPNVGDVADSVRVGDGITELKIDPLNQSISANRYEKLLGILANANWMKLGDFDKVDPIFSGNTATLEYKQNNSIIGRAIFTFVTDTNWNIVLERYINDTNGDILLDDDGTALNLD